MKSLEISDILDLFGPSAEHLLGFRDDAAFDLRLPHSFALRILQDVDATNPRGVRLDGLQGEDQSMVVVHFCLKDIFHVLLRIQMNSDEFSRSSRV